MSGRGCALPSPASIALGLLIAAILISASGAAAASPDLLPAFSLTALRGGLVSAADLKGKPAVINFFASWCASCWAEIPFLQAAHQTYSARGLRVLGIGVLESEDTMRSMVTRLGITYPTVYDASGDTVVKALRLRSMPTTLFVDRQGVVRVRWEGFLDKDTVFRLVGQIL